VEKKEYNDKIAAIRQAIDMDVDLSDTEGMSGKVLILTRMVGLSAEVKARAFKDFQDAKLISYAKHKSEKLTPNVLKIVIEGETSEEAAKLELADRLNAGIVHAIDGLRTIISLRKSELENSLK
jgi:hypothetical protein